MSGFTHAGGALAALAGTVLLALRRGGSAEDLAVCLIFGISMTALFAASGTYHLVTGPARLVRVCHIIDHCMIYVLIAGTYTPLVAAAFTGALKWGYMLGVWVFALGGIVVKTFLTGRFRALSTILYLVMGWAIVFAVVPLARTIAPEGTLLLFTGGLFYTVGGVIYAVKKPNFTKGFGFHELFHVLVLLGALAHYFMVYYYLTCP